MQEVHTRRGWCPRTGLRAVVYAHQIANDRTIILSTEENIQKVHSRPKLWVFEKKRVKIVQKFLWPSDRELPGDYFEI